MIIRDDRVGSLWGPPVPTHPHLGWSVKMKRAGAAPHVLHSGSRLLQPVYTLSADLTTAGPSLLAN